MKFIPQSVKKFWQRTISKGQQKGFKAANTMHKAAINICLLFISYQIYGFLRDYNNFFLNARSTNSFEQLRQGPINKDISQEAE